MKIKLPVTILFSLISICSFGQDTIKVVRKNYIESGVLISSTSKTPFWLRANTLGVIPNTGTNFTLRGRFYQEYATKNNRAKKYSWGYGLNTVANINQDGVDFILPEAPLHASFH